MPRSNTILPKGCTCPIEEWGTVRDRLVTPICDAFVLYDNGSLEKRCQKCEHNEACHAPSKPIVELNEATSQAPTLHPLGKHRKIQIVVFEETETKILHACHTFDTADLDTMLTKRDPSKLLFEEYRRLDDALDKYKKEKGLA